MTRDLIWLAGWAALSPAVVVALWTIVPGLVTGMRVLFPRGRLLRTVASLSRQKEETMGDGA